VEVQSVEIRSIGQKAKTLTLTSDHLVAGGLKVRLEYRRDFTHSPFFANDHGDSKKSQSAFIIGLVYGFGGKI
jgi:Putative beta-barrel porin-2, OmpL-like. bbp2